MERQKNLIFLFVPSNALILTQNSQYVDKQRSPAHDVLEEIYLTDLNDVLYQLKMQAWKSIIGLKSLENFCHLKPKNYLFL